MSLPCFFIEYRSTHLSKVCWYTSQLHWKPSPYHNSSSSSWHLLSTSCVLLPGPVLITWPMVTQFILNITLGSVITMLRWVHWQGEITWLVQGHTANGRTPNWIPPASSSCFSFLSGGWFSSPVFLIWVRSAESGTVSYFSVPPGPYESQHRAGTWWLSRCCVANFLLQLVALDRCNERIRKYPLLFHVKIE